MTTENKRAGEYVGRVLSADSQEQVRQRLSPKTGGKVRRVPGGSLTSPEAVRQRWDLLERAGGRPRPELMDAWTEANADVFKRNIEHFIGTVRVPVGIAGPLRVNGLHAAGDYYLPLATTEAALVASYSRGALAMTEAGGCTAMLLNEGVARAPGFAFRNLIETAEFVAWATRQSDAFKAEAERTTAHGLLIDFRITVEANHVYLTFEFRTADASGQNMATVATDAIFRYILRHTPVRPQHSFVEANLSGDKKASALSFILVRGRKVTAEAVLPADLVAKRFHTTPGKMTDYWRMSAIGGVLSGTIGVQGHYANGLAALYIATGQDAACVAESAVGVTRFELRDDGALYAAVTLPNIIVGTVGGGTGLPGQRACLEMLGLAGANHAPAFAEVCAALALAGELSIIGALSAGDFTRAHEKLARGRRPKTAPP